MLDIIALSPHPDDVELCCGGLVAKMREKGYQIGIIDLTMGELGTEGTAEIRMREAAKAAKILDVQIRENLDLGDCKLSSGFDEAKKLADVIRQYKPSVLVAPYGDEQHPDHAAGKELAKKAAFLANLVKVKTDQEAYRVGAVVYYMLHQPFVPSLVVDVTECYSKKLKAINAYESQRKLMSGVEGLLRSIKLRDQFYGSKIGVKYGEPFFCDVPLKIDDLVEFFR